MAASPAVPLSCEYRIPDAATPASAVSRWSDSGALGGPAIVVVPGSEDDVVAALRYAREKGLRVVAAGGGHGNVVRIDAATLYLDMKRFDGVALDKAAGAVRVGGGAVVRDVARTLCAEGYYTCWPNNNAVGMVGAALGGGSGSVNGFHGFMIDNVLSFRLITAEGKALDLSASSTGDELALFYALCGAGHGLGVVTSLSMRAFPLAGLRMPEDKIWSRRLLFPAAALEAAAGAFVRLRPLAVPLLVTMIYMRAPPGSPAPGAPMISLAASYYGPAGEAEEAAALLFDPEVVGKALKAETADVPFASANDALDALNAHGGYKGIYSCLVGAIDVATFRAGFDRWLAFTDAHEDAKRTMSVFGSWNTDELVKRGKTADGQSKFFQWRDRGVGAYNLTWCSKPETEEAARAYRDECIALYARNEADGPRSFPNNLRPGMELEEMFTPDKIAELKRVKRRWDGDGVFWSPYGDAKVDDMTV